MLQWFARTELLQETEDKEFNDTAFLAKGSRMEEFYKDFMYS